MYYWLRFTALLASWYLMFWLLDVLNLPVKPGKKVIFADKALTHTYPGRQAE